MNHKTIWFGIIILLIALLLAGCSATSQPQKSSADNVTITFTSNPSVPSTGETELIFDIKDQDNQPLIGAEVTVNADHTDMSGMDMNGVATEQGNGKYAITADFPMSGAWKVSVVVRKENLEFTKELELKIQ